MGGVTAKKNGNKTSAMQYANTCGVYEIKYLYPGLHLVRLAASSLSKTAQNRSGKYTPN